MAANVETMARPQRWDSPFGASMTDDVVEELLHHPMIEKIAAEKFPAHTPLGGILQNDTRIVSYRAGDIVVRENDYGNSAFLILDGHLRVALDELPQHLLGRLSARKRGFVAALGQLWSNSWKLELRDATKYSSQSLRNQRTGDPQIHVFLQDFGAILEKNNTARLGPNSLFGELAALGRVPRTATVFAETDAQVLEIRWQGLRELRRYDPFWRKMIDEAYRDRALYQALAEAPYFRDLPPEVLEELKKRTLFEQYGTFDWHTSYKRLIEQGREGEHGTVIHNQGDYPDGVLMVRAGFARVSVELGHGERTLTYLGAGEFYGMDELYAAWKGISGYDGALRTKLTALGYVDVLRIPLQVLEQYVFPQMEQPPPSFADLAGQQISEGSLQEWAVSRRYINGTQAMVIDLDRCTRCDDCVRACASTHGGNPRFIRHGHVHEPWMVANSCMHCTDPVCMIGCPTGAIHRTIEGGVVVINDDTCVGCGTCAASCPYDNIRLVEIRNLDGSAIVDAAMSPIRKATKCDLCYGNPGGPACVRACPHDALRRIDFHASGNIEEAYK